MSESPETLIADLFAKDPLDLAKLSKEDRRPLIEYMRANREKFIASGSSGTKGRTQPVTRAKKEKGPIPDISLDDIQL